MNVLEKAEKAIEYLKNCETAAKSHELQTAAGTLGRCLGALGSRQNYSRHYANLLHSAIPTLLCLASNDSAEIRLVGDEALNRAVVGGFAFHAYKTNIVLQNQIDHTKNARWIRAALSRVCLGECWLRPGVGKIRSQAQTLFPKLSQIVRLSSEIQLIVETLESNLPRVLNALAEYTTDEEITELSKALLSHVESSEPAVRRGVATCIGHLCSHRDVLIAGIMKRVFDNLWPQSSDNSVILGWFGVVKSIFQINDITGFAENNLFTVQDYLELYHLCIHYIEQSTVEHNIQNAIIECLSILLSQATGECKKALLEKHPKCINLDLRKDKGHSRNISSTSGLTSVISNRVEPLSAQESHDLTEMSFSGGLRLGSLSQLNTPSRSIEDLTIQTPDSPTSEMDIPLDSEQLSKDLEKLQMYETDSIIESELDPQQGCLDVGFKINIGSVSDDDIPLKYCARLLASKFLLTGNKGGLIPDRSVRVSVKSSALNCLSEILQLYPQAMTMYVDKDADNKNHNISGSSEATDQDNINDFILERNVCYQDSLTDSLSQDLLNKSMDSQTSHPIAKKERSLEKSMDSVEQKSSSKDVQSNIFDSKVYAKNDLMTSGISADSSNLNMTNSNVTSNSNMTGSYDPTFYPMTSSGEILSSSIDLDMKFDHFGESNTNLENLKELERPKRPLRRTDVIKEVVKKSLDICDEKADDSKEFECQHMSEVFILLYGHNDPQIRGLVRVCIGNYLNAALDLSHGDYYRWKNYSVLPKDVSGNIGTDKLVEIVLKGLSDSIHSCVNHTLTATTKICSALSTSRHYKLMADILIHLTDVEDNKYWLCKVNLCKLYERLPYCRLFMLLPNFMSRRRMIMNTLYRLLADQDQRVRNAAANTIAVITPKMYPPRRQTPTNMALQIAVEQSRHFNFDAQTLSLGLVRDMYFYHDLPEQLVVNGRGDDGALRIVVGELMARLMQSSCKYYSQGLSEALLSVSSHWAPSAHKAAYTEHGILDYCLDQLDCCNDSIARRTVMLQLCTLIYPVEIHNIMRHRTANHHIFERDTSTSKWGHLENERMAKLSEKFQTIILRILNIVVHLVEEVNPSAQMNKGAFPGSPVRRNTQDATPRKSSIDEDKGSLRKKPQMVITNLRANFAGNFYSEPFYLKLYDNLRATYSNHKINLDPKSSMFHGFLSTVLDALAIQLELSTEKEFGYITEELLYYLKTIMPLKADKSVYCVTQLLKCLFGTNFLNQYPDFMAIAPKEVEAKENLSFFEDVLLINSLGSAEDLEKESRRNSFSSNCSQKMALESKNPKLTEERKLLVNLENFHKNKTDKKWSTNKKELERYIRLFEPVVIQALKSYTMQNDIPLQCKVLCLLNQLLTLRVNYCMLDSDQIFIGFLLKQLDLVEQHEIPNCVELVSEIILFLVHLSSSKHHTKQIIELPKLIQLCDGLLASGAQTECIAALERVSYLAFGVPHVMQTQQQAIAREVLQAMHSKCLHTPRAIDLVSCVLSLSHDTYTQGSTIACDTLLSLLSKRTIEIDDRRAVTSLERLIDYIYKDVLLEQCRVELVLKILFQAPPPQSTTPFKHKLRYLSIIMVLLRKVLVLIPESEILLSINYLKSTHISPQSIFFNVKTDIDPLNVQNVNETCANLSPDVILVRLLFKTLTYAILELDNCHEMECANLDLEDIPHKGENHRLLYEVTVNLICQVKHMLHLTNGCLFPLTAKTAQNILHAEQSGLNTGLYSPAENIPLELVNLICLRAAHRATPLTVHWSHLLIRLKFLEQKYWQNLLGFVRNMPLSSDCVDRDRQQLDILQIGCFMAYCEYFIENGLTEVVHLSWLLINRIHIVVSQYSDTGVRALVSRVNESASSSGLLLQAVAARCAHRMKGEFALNTHAILSGCHESQSGPLIFLICRIIGKLEPAVAIRYAKLATERCNFLKELPLDDILVQLTKEDVQVALEMLQRDNVHIRYPSVVLSLNSLAVSVFDLSPLDLSQERAVNPLYTLTTNVDSTWLVNLVKNRCCQTAASIAPKVEKQLDLAILLSNLPQDDLKTVLSCPEFDRKLLKSCFKVACDNYLKDFLNIISAHESKEHEKDNLRRQRQLSKIKEELSNIDSNKLNTLHVFKKSDNKESKSQFFIPMNDNVEKEKFGNLQLSEDDTEIVPPNLPALYTESVVAFDKSLTEIIRLFPKQNRPLSQSENFNLSLEQTIDRYSKRCQLIFQDKQFYQEFFTTQTIMTGFLDALRRILCTFDEIDCDIIDKHLVNILPPGLTKNIATFSVISLQYLSFLIKNKKIVESPVNNDVSFRVTNAVTEKVVIDKVIGVTLENVAKALKFKEIWSELNVEKNDNKTQSAICCLYAIVKYFVKDTKPLTLKSYLDTKEPGPKSDIVLICDKLLTLIQYWEKNFYERGLEEDNEIMRAGCKESIESILVCLARLDIVSQIALIPPIAWSSVEVSSKKEELHRVDMPLQALEDLDVLEAFLFRVNIIGWSSKKQFEEVWMSLLAAVGGAGSHLAVSGMQQLLLSTVALRDDKAVHIARLPSCLHAGQQRLRTILVGTPIYSDLFDHINLERIPLLKDGYEDGYHYAQFSTEFLRVAAGQESPDVASYSVRLQLKRMKRNKDIDVNSCLQLLLDIASNMLEPKAETGLAARAALINCLLHCSDLFTSQSAWHSLRQQVACLNTALLAPLSERAYCLLHHAVDPTPSNQRLLKSITSTYAPLRQAAIHGCLTRLHSRPYCIDAELVAHLRVVVGQYLDGNCIYRISLYEQGLYWSVLFSLIEFGHPELMNLAVDFLIQHSRHFCADLVVKGITSTIRQQVLPKELKNTIIEKLLDNLNNFSEHHAIQILLVHLFSADNRLLSPKLTSDVSNMDPDVLMNSMERITLLYKTLRDSKHSSTKSVTTTTLQYFLRETLPPAATLSRVVIEFVESCKSAQKIEDGVLSDWAKWVAASVCSGMVVFEVFETAIVQDQLPVLSGWIFEALCHLLSGKITSDFLPYCVTLLLISASSNGYIRKIAPLAFHILRLGFENNKNSSFGGVFKDFLVKKGAKMSFSDRRLLCIVALHSNFATPQLERLKELCEGNDCLNDLFRCLTAT